MTSYELQQVETVIIHAGRTAFLIGVTQSSNPYRRNSKFSKLWGVGFKQAKRNDDKKKLPNGRYRVYFEPIVENPKCIRCNTPVIGRAEQEESRCPKCGDWYKHTEFEIKDENAKRKIGNRPN